VRYKELIEDNDSDRELFGATPDTPARQELKKISIEELKQRRRELLAYVRTIARRHFNAATKVSGSKSFGTITMLFGKEDQYSPNTQRLVAGVKAYLDDAGLQNKITDAGWLSVKVPDEVPTDLSEDIDDEELFGKSRNQVIAQGLYAEAAKERDVAEEERAIGDLENSEHFAQQVAETEALAREFEVSLHNGMRAWRGIKDRWRRNDFADIVEYHTNIDLHEISKMFSEDLDEPTDDELFGQDKYNFGNMTADEVKEKFNDLHDGLYGYDAQYNDDEDEAELQAELTALMNYVRIRFNNHFYEYLRRQLDQEAPDNWLERHNSRNTDPLGRRRDYDWPNNDRLTKAGKLYKQDQKTAARVVKDRLGKHHTPNLPESDNSDEELFGKEDDTRKTIRTLRKLRQLVEQDPQGRGIGKLLQRYDNSNSSTQIRADLTWEYIARRMGMTVEQFHEAAPDLMFPGRFEWTRPWQLWDLKTIDQSIDFFLRALGREGMNEDHSDEELFGETTLADRIAQLLQAKQKVFTRLMGARGQVMRVDDSGNLVLRTSPRSTTRYSWGGVASNPEKYKLTGNPAGGKWYVDYAEDPWDSIE
jgi:hypothetical protein